ncbi:MAG: hypothetical protein A2Y16_03520 [Tenericutes bacterium GWF2_57_13]|nr:MAG: hypothetical protein A2Y16_03520 [Tenericutes bacterium GWF2_57_13]
MLTIRRAAPSDAEALLSYLKIVGGESDNLLFGAEGVAYAIEQERDLLGKLAEAKTSAMFIGTVGDRVVSVVNLNAPTRARTAHTSEIGVSVLRSYWNQGVASAMLEHLVAFARSTGILKVIHLSVRCDNVRAVHVYEKLGFVHIGTYERYMQIDGAFIDVFLMNLYL